MDISMRAAEVSFVEPSDGAQASEFDEWRYYRRPAELQFWAIDEERDQATSVGRFRWMEANASRGTGS